MANPSPQAIEAVRATMPDWSKPDAEVLADLLADTVPNPVPRGTVAKGFESSDVILLLSQESVHAVLALPPFDNTIRPLMDAPDPKTPDQVRQLCQWAGGLYKGGFISGAEYAALAVPPDGLFLLTSPDPAWAADIPAIEATIGRPVDLADIAASRPEA